MTEDRSTIVAGTDASVESTDGLAVARLLADLEQAELVVARVMPDMLKTPVHDRSSQRRVRARMAETGHAVVAALPGGEETDPHALVRPVGRSGRCVRSPGMRAGRG